MKVRNMESNMLINISSIKEDNNGNLIANARKTNGESFELTLTIEKDETVKEFGKSEYRRVTKEDWSNYLQSLVDANYKESELVDEYKTQLNDRGDVVEERIEQLEDLAELTDEQEKELESLEAERKEIRKLKKDPSEFLKAKKEEVQQKVLNKELFLFGGMSVLTTENGKVYSAEIPHQDKKTRNLKSPRPGIVMNYTISNNGKPVTLNELNDKSFDTTNLKLESTLAKNNTIENINDVFMINENTLNSILNNSKFGDMFYNARTIKITSEIESPALNKLIDFRSKNTFEQLNEQKIETLKNIYKDIKEEIFTNGQEKYNIVVPVIANNNQIKSLAEQFKNSIEGSIVRKIISKDDEIPGAIEIKNMVGIQEVPTNVINGINTANQWYAAKGFAPNIFAPSNEVIAKKSFEMFGSLDVINQVKEIAKNELNTPKIDVEIEEISIDK